MKEVHPLGPQLTVFDGAEPLHSAQEQDAATTLFKSLIGDAKLNHIDSLNHIEHELPADDETGTPESYVTTRLLLERRNHPDSTLGLENGRLEIAIQTHDIDNPAVPETKDPASIGITYYDSSDTKGAQVAYRLGRDGVVRRTDISLDSTTRQLEANELATSKAALEEDSQEAWDREVARQIGASALRDENQKLEAIMNLNGQPVGIKEMDWLNEVVTFANPAATVTG